MLTYTHSYKSTHIHFIRMSIFEIIQYEIDEVITDAWKNKEVTSWNKRRKMQAPIPSLELQLGLDRFHHKKPNNPITQDFLQHHINWEIGCYIDMVNRVGRRYFPRCQIYIRPLWFLSNIWIIQGHLTDMQIWQEHSSPSPRNLAGTYFASVCAMAIPFIVKNVPETKGKTLEEIQASINW